MGAGGDGGGNGATVTVGAEGVTVGAGGVVGLEQAASAKPISITIVRRMSLSDTTSKNLMGADRGQRGEAGGAIEPSLFPREVPGSVKPTSSLIVPHVK